MKTQLIRTSIFALLSAAAVYAAGATELKTQAPGVSKTSIPVVMKAMSLAVEATPADISALGNQPEEQDSGKANREKPPVLMAPGQCPGCRNPYSFSTWERVQIALSLLHWI